MNESSRIPTPVPSLVSSNSSKYSASFKSEWLVPSTPSPSNSQIDMRTATSTPKPADLDTTTLPTIVSASRTNSSPSAQKTPSVVSSSKSKYSTSYNPTWAVKTAPSRAASVIAPLRPTQPPQPPQPPQRSRASAHSGNDGTSAASNTSGEARPKAPVGYADGRSEGSTNFSEHSNGYSLAAHSSSTNSTEARPLAPFTYTAPLSDE